MEHFSISNHGYFQEVPLLSVAQSRYTLSDLQILTEIPLGYYNNPDYTEADKTGLFLHGLPLALDELPGLSTGEPSQSSAELIHLSLINGAEPEETPLMEKLSRANARDGGGHRLFFPVYLSRGITEKDIYICTILGMHISQRLGSNLILCTCDIITMEIADSIFKQVYMNFGMTRPLDKNVTPRIAQAKLMLLGIQSLPMHTSTSIVSKN